MNRHWLLSLLFITLLGASGWWFFNQPLSPSPSVVSEADIPTLFIQAEKAFASGDYQATIKLYEEILEREPTNLAAALGSAHTYRYWGKFSESEKMFLHALTLDESDPWIYTDLGKLYRNTGEYEKAETMFHTALTIDPDSANTYSYGLGYLYIEMKRYEEAEAMFKTALSIDEGNEMALSGLADLYRELGRYAEAAVMYERVFALYPTSESYLGLAWLHIYQENYSDAITACENFLSQIREKGEVYYTMGIAYDGLGKTEQAQAAYARAVALNPDNKMFQKALTPVR